MDCDEARRLINQGFRPGSQNSQRSQLGFHLSQCENCRVYLEQYERRELDQLLDRNRPSITRHQAGTTAQTKPRTRRSGVLLTRTILTLLVSIPLLILIWAAGIAMRTEQNLAAMIVTPVPTDGNTLALADADHGAEEIAAVPVVTATLSATPTSINTTTAAPAPPAPTSPPTPTEEVVAISRLIVENDAAVDVLPSPMPRPTLQQLPSPIPIPTVTPSPVLTPVPADEAVTVLLLGSDQRPDETKAPRTDVVMLVRIDPVQQRIALLSLVRDMWVEIPGFGPNRVNMAYLFGEEYNLPGGGMQLAANTVSNALGIQIDYVIIADFDGFIDLIDTLGGITVNVEKELYDDRFPTMDYGYTTAHFLPGPQKMDGILALTYSRIRHPDSDFMRIRRQQAVMAAIGARLRERGDFRNIAAADKITGSLVGYVKTDMPRDRILELVWTMRNHDIAYVERYTVTGDMVTAGVGNDLYALVPDPAALNQLTRSFMGQP